MTNEKYINLFTDFGFKKIFGTESNKDLLIDFLNNLLEKEISPIKNITYLKNEQLGKKQKDRNAIFDLYCEDETGKKLIIELQRAEQTFFKDRSIYYATFPIQEQAKKGDWDYQITPVYSISIMNFKFDEQFPDKVLSYIDLKDRETNKIFFDKLSFVYLEMPKFTKNLQQCNSNLEKWLYVFKNIHLLDKMPPELKERAFLKLFEQCKIANYNAEERMKYEEDYKYHNDMYAVLKTAELKGEVKGKIEEKQKVAINAIKKGFDNQTISDLTGLSILEIEKIREKII